MTALCDEVEAQITAVEAILLRECAISPPFDFVKVEGAGTEPCNGWYQRRDPLAIPQCYVDLGWIDGTWRKTAGHRQWYENAAGSIIYHDRYSNRWNMSDPSGDLCYQIESPSSRPPEATA